MLKRYKNSLLETVAKEQVDPRIFELSAADLEGNSAIEFLVRGTLLRFVVATSPDDPHKFRFMYTRFAPAVPKSRISDWYDFGPIRAYFERWLNESVKLHLEEQVMPDLWNQLEPGKTGADLLLHDLDNSPFTEHEHSRVQESLLRVLREVRSHNVLTSEQIELLEERLEYLIESSARLGRKDWLICVLGAVFGLVLQAGLTGEAGRYVSKIVWQAVEWAASQPVLLP